MILSILDTHIHLPPCFNACEWTYCILIEYSKLGVYCSPCVRGIQWDTIYVITLSAIVVDIYCTAGWQPGVDRILHLICNSIVIKISLIRTRNFKVCRVSTYLLHSFPSFFICIRFVRYGFVILTLLKHQDSKLFNKIEEHL